MRSRALLLAVVLALGAPAARAAPAPAAERVDAAIERGVAWLLEEQEARGGWGSGSRTLGHTALVTWVLLHAGLREDGATREDRALGRALALLDRTGPGRGRARDDAEAETYATSLLLLVLLDRGRPEDRPRTERLVRLLERMQADNGQWSYAGARGPRPGAGDNSNTQLAVLALGAATGAGLAVETGVLQRAWGWWRTSAQPDGGFGYASGGARASASTGSMTAAGIASLAILEAALLGEAPGEGPPVGPVRDRAVRRLGEGFEVDRNFGPTVGGVAQRQRQAGRGWLHYFLWSVERSMVLAGHDELGGRDWYAEGAEHLLGTQKDDGSWRGEHPLYATAFALLFLVRAADPASAFVPPARGPVTPSEGGRPAAPPPDAAAPEGDVAAWLAAGLAPARIADGVRAHGAGALAALVAALDHRDPAVRDRALGALGRLLAPERLAGVADRRLARGRLALWVRRHAAHLVQVEGRFVLP